MEQNNSGQEANDTPPASQAATGNTAKRPAWSWRKRLLLSAVVLGGIGALTIGGAEYYTAQPSFCRSCHIMEPYWQSWIRDVHGSEYDIACVDCHYAPGERHTLNAKFKGLSQAVSYFSGRAGASRPRAHVNDESCLRSGCHDDQAYMNEKLPIGEVRTEKRVILGAITEIRRTPTVTFLHEKHMQIESVVAENRQALEDATNKLRAALPENLLSRVEDLARSVQPFPERIVAIQNTLESHTLADKAETAVEMARLIDRAVRLEQLEGLNCAACHTYDATGENHFAVDELTCYTCHFANQAFNRETGQCLNCHEPPTREIVVHAAPMASQPSIMNHQDILDRDIDCASCHLDVIQGHARVSARECQHCHDRETYLVEFETRTLETVAEYHRVHVARQRARCPDCHGAIRHELIEPTLVATSVGFLKPVLDDCQHCHPNHHDSQVELLMGLGGVNVPQPMPNAMFGSRLNCRACHKEAGTDFKGDPLIEATADTCVACHEEKYGDLLRQWLQEIEAYLAESERALEQVRHRVEQRREEGKKVPERVEQLIDSAAHNIDLVKKGNGIHNRNFATTLLDSSDDMLRKAIELLSER